MRSDALAVVDGGGISPDMIALGIRPSRSRARESLVIDSQATDE